MEASHTDSVAIRYVGFSNHNQTADFFAKSVIMVLIFNLVLVSYSGLVQIKILLRMVVLRLLPQKMEDTEEAVLLRNGQKKRNLNIS